MKTCFQTTCLYPLSFICKSLALVLFLFSASTLTAQFQFSSTQSGDWNDCATWGDNSPDEGDIVTIASGHTITVPEGTDFEVGQVIFTDNTSRLVMAGPNSRLRYTTTDLGYSRIACCNTPKKPEGVDDFQFLHQAGANTSFREVHVIEILGIERQRYDVDIGQTVGNIILTEPELPNGAVFVRWVSDVQNLNLDGEIIPDPDDPRLSIIRVDKTNSPATAWALFEVRFEYTDRYGCETHQSDAILFQLIYDGHLQ